MRKPVCLWSFRTHMLRVAVLGGGGGKGSNEANLSCALWHGDAWPAR